MYATTTLLSALSIAAFLPYSFLADAAPADLSRSNLIPRDVPSGGGNWSSIPPDVSKDPFPPYFSGGDLSTLNIAGTYLFGWKGCLEKERKIIADTFKDFHRLVEAENVYKSIDWDSQAAKDFWGTSKDPKKVIPQARKSQIQHVFSQAQQMTAGGLGSIYIEVRCSGGDGRGDPENACGDRQHRDQCSTGEAPRNGGNTKLQAYSDPTTDFWK